MRFSLLALTAVPWIPLSLLVQIIPYIASQFRKDKIWLRRTKPSKRQYQVVVAIDNSRSMRDTAARSMACEAMATICKAMAKLEVTPVARTHMLLLTCTCTLMWSHSALRLSR